MIDEKKLVETFAREFEATKSLNRAVMAVARDVLAHEEDDEDVVEGRSGLGRTRLSQLDRQRNQEIVAEVALETSTTVEAMLAKEHMGWKMQARSRWLAGFLMRRRRTMWRDIAQALGCSPAAVYLGIGAVTKRDPEFIRQAEAVWERLSRRWETKEAA